MKTQKTTANTMMVRVSGISKRYGERIALKDVSFDIKRGSIVGIIGPNGAGKTVLVNIILGREQADGGTVQRQQNAPIAAIAQRDLADPFVMPLSVYEFLRMSGSRASFAELQHSLRSVELDDAVLRQNFYALSGGDRQKAVLARALLVHPKLLVLDEPFSAVDYAARHVIYRLLKRINKELDTTIILVSHDSESIIAVCDDVLCLNQTIHKDCHIVEFMQGKHPSIKRVEHLCHDA